MEHVLEVTYNLDSREFTFNTVTYLGENLTITGNTMAIIELRNMIADAARYHKMNDRQSWSNVLWKFWEQLEIPEYEENE